MSWHRFVLVPACCLIALASTAQADEVRLTDDQLDRVVAGNPFGINFGGLDNVSIGGPAFVIGLFGGILGGGGGGGSDDPPPAENGGNGGPPPNGNGGNGSPPSSIGASASSAFSGAFDGGPGSIIAPGTSSLATVSLDDLL